ncbi:MAG TPA: restriction endonuclease subunit S, partial [Candidatus Paceibacterota bacterium]|nr:restriction endonuclease subunit S [Candidatus Paceibacterota bacterium]
DVMLANPPFMSPKGGIRPHKRFSVQANRSEVLFVDYILEHLRPNGRAGIIVPEGIIFQSATAYKALRKLLIEDGLLAVVSLPAGVFNPYTGVKTSILLFDNGLAKKTKDILFLKISNDGYDLGAQRREIDKNDLPLALEIVKEYKTALKEGKEIKLNDEQGKIAHLVAKDKIAESGDYNLSGDRYKESKIKKYEKWPIVEIDEIIDLNFGTRITKKDNQGTEYPVYGGGGESFRTDNFNRENEIVISRFAMSEQCVRFVNGKFFLLDSGFTYSVKSEAKNKVSKEFIDKIFLSKQKEIYDCSRGHAQRNLDVKRFKKIKIPLPPLEVQKEIVEQIEVKQKAIEAAKAVIENLEKERRYFGQEIRKIKDVEWVELGELLENVKYTNKIQKSEFKQSGKFPIIDQSQNFIAGYWEREKDVFIIKKPVIIFGDHTRTIKYVDFNFVLGADGVKILQPNNKIISKFLYFILLSSEIKNLGYSRHFKELVRLKIPVPPIEIQKQLVAEMEEQEKIIEANKKLIGIMEQKIAEVLNDI